MLKKLTVFFPFAFLLLSLNACSSETSLAPPKTTPPSAAASTSNSSTEPPPEAEQPLLDADATDEELLEALGDAINVVAEEDYFDTVTELIESPADHSGKFYQLEGTFSKEGDDPYISRTFPDNGHNSEIRLPLKYLPQEPEENTPIRVTGIINEGTVGSKTVTVLEVHVLEILESQ